MTWDKAKVIAAEIIISFAIGTGAYWVRHRVNAKIQADTRVAIALEKIARAAEKR